MNNPVARLCYSLSGVLYSYAMWTAISYDYYFLSGVMLGGVLWSAYEHDKVSVVKKK